MVATIFVRRMDAARYSFARIERSSITGYTRVVAKVMISLPDDLVASIDAEASRRGTTRSGLIRSYAHEALRRRAEERAARVEQLMTGISAHGGDGVEQLKRLRPKS